MEQKLTKKPYESPTLIEHGVVRDLTQTGSGGRRKKPKKPKKAKKPRH
jgi:hypothetical protein